MHAVERPLHPLHAILLAFPVALSCAAVATDLAYLDSAVMQWSNFSAWLIAGTAFFGGLVLAWALMAFFFSRRRGRSLAYLLLIAAMWVLSVFNSLKHASDAWSSVGTAGLILSIATAILALLAAWIAFSGTVRETAR